MVLQIILADNLLQNTMQLVKYLRVLSAIPLNKVYVVHCSQLVKLVWQLAFGGLVAPGRGGRVIWPMYKGATEGMKTWPYSGQKRPKIWTLSRTSLSIILAPCLGHTII